MVLPRSSRLLLAALVLLANAVTPDLVCAEHGGHGAVAASPAGVEHHGAGEHTGAPAAPADPCDEPAIPSCCPVLMSCSFSLDAGQGRTTLDGAGSAGIPTARWASHLLSRSTTPDPPPPKI